MGECVEQQPCGLADGFWFPSSTAMECSCQCGSWGRPVCRCGMG